MASKTALITGVTGQDGSYLAELLLEQGYRVYGTTRHHLTRPVPSYIQALLDHERFWLVTSDLASDGDTAALIGSLRPDEAYNLAAQTFVPTSFASPAYTLNVNTLGPARLIQAIKLLSPETRFYQASSSEQFGTSPPPQSEATPFQPVSPYGISKLAAHLLTVQAREADGLFACCGICFNHESPRRPPAFVTRKITRAAAAIRLGFADSLDLGNLDAVRDWGYAPEYVRAIWQMLQQPEPKDYVLATGADHRVLDFVRLAFVAVGLDWRDYVTVVPDLVRPQEVPALRGVARLAWHDLGWRPKTSLESLVEIMVAADLEALKPVTRRKPAVGKPGALVGG